MGISFFVRTTAPTPSAQLLAAQEGTPYGTVFNRTDDSFSEAFNYSTIFNNDVYDMKYSHDDTYIAITSVITPFLSIYKDPNFTSSPLSFTIPTSYCSRCSWSSDSIYLAVGLNADPRMLIYKRSGDTFTQLATVPNATSWGQINDVAFDPTDTYLSVCGTSGGLKILKRSGDTFTNIANPYTGPYVTRSTAWSPDSKYVALGLPSLHDGIRVYKRTGDTFSSVTIDALVANAWGYGVSFNPDGTLLAVAHSFSPFITLYSVDSDTDTFTKLSAPSDLPGQNAYGCAFDKTGTYLAVIADGSSNSVVYSVDGTTLTKVADLATNGSNNISWSNT